MFNSFSSRIRLILITASLAFSCTGLVVAAQPQPMTVESLGHLTNQVDAIEEDKDNKILLKQATDTANSALKNTQPNNIKLHGLYLFNALVGKKQEFEAATAAATQVLASTSNDELLIGVLELLNRLITEKHRPAGPIAIGIVKKTADNDSGTIKLTRLHVLRSLIDEKYSEVYQLALNAAEQHVKNNVNLNFRLAAQDIYLSFLKLLQEENVDIAKFLDKQGDIIAAEEAEKEALIKLNNELFDTKIHTADNTDAIKAFIEKSTKKEASAPPLALLSTSLTHLRDVLKNLNTELERFGKHSVRAGA